MTEYLLIGSPAHGLKLAVKYGRSIMYRCPDTDKRYSYILNKFFYNDREFNIATFDVTDSEIISAIQQFAM